MILKEQASILGQRTGNLVKAEVRQNHASGKTFTFHFLIVAPPLDNYIYKLFEISYNIEFYPLRIKVDTAILKELNPERAADPLDLEVESEEKFMEILKKIFKSEKTRQVIDSLLAMMNYDHPDYEKDMAS